MNANTNRRNQYTILLIFLLFFAPLALSWGLYFYWQDWQPTSRTNYGTLISPARPLPLIALETVDQQLFHLNQLQGKWTLVTITQGRCVSLCQQNLYKMRQVRLALGKDMERVQRMLLVKDKNQLSLTKPLLAEYPGMFILTGSDMQLKELLNTIDEQLSEKLDKIYIIDPLGNVMMNYKPDVDPSNILKDMKHLLKLSKIG